MNKGKNYIYLDSNVIQYMKHDHKINEYYKGKDLEKLLLKISKKYILPYSGTHFADLMDSFEKNPEYIEEDLDYINTITKGYAIGYKGKNNDLLIEKHDIRIDYNEMKKQHKKMKNEKLNVNVKSNINIPIPVDLSKMDKSTIIYKFIEKNGGFMNDIFFNDFINYLCDNFDNPSVIKKLRNDVMKLNQMFENTPNSILDQNSFFFKNSKDFLLFMEIADINVLEKDFDKYLKSYFYATEYNDGQGSSLDKKIHKAYMLLGMSPLFKDNFTKKNKPSNTYRDADHIFYATESKYMITQDNNFYKKSKFIARVFNLKVKVLKIEEFMNKFETFD